jgi:hypothetical protein
LNLKDYVLNYLNTERNSLERQINRYQKIKNDELLDSEGKKELLDRMVEFDRQHSNSYFLNLKYDFIQSRTALMHDAIRGHMPEFLPGSKALKKYGESRSILKQIENQVTSYMSKSFSSKMNDMVEVSIQEEVLVEELDADGKTITVPRMETKTVMKNAALEELDQIITLANTLEYNYCFAYDRP